jgi:hypothetical protein
VLFNDAVSCWVYMISIEVAWVGMGRDWNGVDVGKLALGEKLVTVKLCLHHTWNGLALGDERLLNNRLNWDFVMKFVNGNWQWMLIYLCYWKGFLDPKNCWLLKKGFCCLGFAIDRVALAYLSTKVKYPRYRPTWPRGVQEVKAHSFLDTWRW